MNTCCMYCRTAVRHRALLDSDQGSSSESISSSTSARVLRGTGVPLTRSIARDIPKPVMHFTTSSPQRLWTTAIWGDSGGAWSGAGAGQTRGWLFQTQKPLAAGIVLGQLPSGGVTVTARTGRTCSLVNPCSSDLRSARSIARKRRMRDPWYPNSFTHCQCAAQGGEGHHTGT